MTILRARVHQLWVVTPHRLSWPCFPSIPNAAMKTIFCFLALMIMNSYLQQQTQKCLKTFKVPLSRVYLYPSFLICYWAIDPNSARDTSLCYPVKKISKDIKIFPQEAPTSGQSLFKTPARPHLTVLKNLRRHPERFFFRMTSTKIWQICWDCGLF